MFLILSLVATTLCAQIPVVVKHKTDSLYQEFIDAHPFVPGHTLHLYKPNSWEYISSIGISKIEDNSPMEDNMQFKQASITKMFNAAVIMQLVEENKLSLNDKLVDILPQNIVQYFTYSAQITVANLLQHKSGLIDPQWDFQGPMNRWIYCKRNEDIPKDSLLFWASGGFIPDQEHRYSNTNFVLTAIIIETILNKSYHSAIQERIIQPLNLSNTGFSFNVNSPIMNGYLGSSFFPGACYQEIDSIYNFTDASNSWGYGSADLISTTSDLIKFLEAWHNNVLFSAETKAIQLSPNVYAGDRAHMGNGIFKYNLLGGTEVYALGHSGSAFGYGSLLIYYPEFDVYLVGASNYMKIGYGFLAEKIYQVLKENMLTNTPNPILSPIQVFPNPAFDVITVSGLTDPEAIITIKDAFGKEIMTNLSQHINVSGLTPGLYFGIINGANVKRVFKFIKS